MEVNKSKVKKENNNEFNLHLEVHQYKDKKSFIISEGDNTSKDESIENASGDKFDWDWIFEKGWLRIKK